jgi:hypothetical protein
VKFSVAARISGPGTSGSVAVKFTVADTWLNRPPPKRSCKVAGKAAVAGHTAIAGKQKLQDRVDDMNEQSFTKSIYLCFTYCHADTELNRHHCSVVFIIAERSTAASAAAAGQLRTPYLRVTAAREQKQFSAGRGIRCLKLQLQLLLLLLPFHH